MVDEVRLALKSSLHPNKKTFIIHSSLC
ncbi:protein of unknown function [Kingella kingae]|nr:protein of unknown function [Kingella kingae]